MPSDHWVPDLVHKLTQNSMPEPAEKERIHAVEIKIQALCREQEAAGLHQI